jgi:hypothetical protein
MESPLEIKIKVNEVNRNKIQLAMCLSQKNIIIIKLKVKT